MTFSYHPEIGRTFPELFTGILLVSRLPAGLVLSDAVAHLEGEALRRLTNGPESEIPAIRAWRAAFSTMGMKPTQYRCASEALLRRLRKDGALPRLNPIVDVCNATSAAQAVPVAAFDLDRIAGNLTVRPAGGDEIYAAFGGGTEHPDPGEIVFADDIGAAHARRWTNRQSAASAISPDTRTMLIVIEGLHEGAARDVLTARDALAELFGGLGAVVRKGNLHGGAGQFATSGEDQ